MESCDPVRRVREDDCAVTPEDPPKKPDPALYSQREEFQAGNTPTWDSPDVVTNSFFPWKITDQVHVTVRNRSSEATAVGTDVSVATTPFGIGLETTARGTKTIDLPPGSEKKLLFPLPKDVRERDDQRIGAFVDVHHPHDAVAINSAGAQVTYGVQVEPGTEHDFSVPVRNDAAAKREIELTAHVADLTASVSPGTRQYDGWEQVNATLSVDVPASGVQGLQMVTVVATTAGGDLVGGLTYRIHVGED